MRWVCMMKWKKGHCSPPRKVMRLASCLLSCITFCLSITAMSVLWIIFFHATILVIKLEYNNPPSQLWLHRWCHKSCSLLWPGPQFFFYHTLAEMIKKWEIVKYNSSLFNTLGRVKSVQTKTFNLFLPVVPHKLKSQLLVCELSTDFHQLSLNIVSNCRSIMTGTLKSKSDGKLKLAELAYFVCLGNTQYTHNLCL